ncbi:MAG: hypothetical protein SGARI_006159, partial [Bacillariaceae sp.]
MKAFRGFKRFDNESSLRNDRKIKTSSSRRGKHTDHSVLPILNFEDSGLSPVNSPRRWDPLNDKEEVENIDIFEMNRKQESVVSSGTAFASPPENPTSIKMKYEKTHTENKNVVIVPKNIKDIPSGVRVRGEAKQGQQRLKQVVKSETMEDVFDPFRMDDDEEKPSQQQTFPLIDLTDFDFNNDNWREFTVEHDKSQLFSSKNNDVGPGHDQESEAKHQDSSQ